MWYSTQLVITWLVHWFMDSMALMICKDIIVHHYCSLVVHLEELGGGGLLVVHVVPHQVLVLVRQQQGHLHTNKAQTGSFQSLHNLGPHGNQVVGEVLQQLKIKITMISFNIDINVVIMALAIIPAQWSS